MSEQVKLLTVRDVASRLHISVGTARNRLCQNFPMPPSLRVGRRRLFPEREFEIWLEGLAKQDPSFSSIQHGERK